MATSRILDSFELFDLGCVLLNVFHVLRKIQYLPRFAAIIDITALLLQVRQTVLRLYGLTLNGAVDFWLVVGADQRLLSLWSTPHPVCEVFRDKSKGE